MKRTDNQDKNYALCENLFHSEQGRNKKNHARKGFFKRIFALNNQFAKPTQTLHHSLFIILYSIFFKRIR